jgi:hypothetical protein
MEKFVPEIRKIRYASLIFTPFKAADISALKNKQQCFGSKIHNKEL